MTDNTNALRKHADEVIEKALTEVGVTAVGYVSMLVPVETGRLKNSITFATKGYSGYTHNYKDDNGNAYSQRIGKVKDASVNIGTNVEYAAAVEFREKAQHITGQAHYLRDGITNHLDEYKQILKENLEEG